MCTCYKCIFSKDSEILYDSMIFSCQIWTFLINTACVKSARRPGDERGKFPLEGSLGMDRRRGGRLPRFDSARGPGYNGATKNLVMVMLCGWQPLIRLMSY